MTRANINWSAKQVAKMFKNGSFRFDNIIQRSYVWENKRKSDLIHSMIEGYPIPPFYARRVDGKVYDFLDGKQRISAIAGFINGEYALEGMPDFTYEDDNGNEVIDNFDGMTFDCLPEEVQDVIKDYSLTIYYYEDITDQQIREMFRKLNNGKPLSAKEKNIASMIDIRNITDIGKHEVWKKIFTQKAIEARKQLPVIMKAWAMLNEDINKVSFDSKTFNSLVSETETTEEEREQIVSCLDFYCDVLTDITNKDTRKKVCNETNFVSLIPFMDEAIETGVNHNIFADWLMEIFTGETSVSVEYANAAVSGAAKNGNIVKRNSELEKSWDEFFKADEETEDADETETEETETTYTEYKYGMRLRGFSPRCQPMDGFVRREDANNNNYWDIIVYNRELSEEEVNHYSLDRIM